MGSTNCRQLKNNWGKQMLGSKKCDYKIWEKERGQTLVREVSQPSARARIETRNEKGQVFKSSIDILT